MTYAVVTAVRTRITRALLTKGGATRIVVSFITEMPIIAMVARADEPTERINTVTMMTNAVYAFIYIYITILAGESILTTTTVARTH